MSNPPPLWCWVFGDTSKHPSRRLFSVRMSHEASVGELKNAIKEERRPLFTRIDAATLDLYKISVIEDNLDAELGAVDLNFLKNLKVLLPKNKLSQVLSDPPTDDHVDIIVVLPPGVSLTDVKITRNDVSTSHNINLLPYLTFTAPARGQFGGEDNVSRNDIEELKSPTEPQFLRDLRSKLRQRRWITSTTNTMGLPKLCGVRFGYYYEENVAELVNSENADRVASSHELWHLAGAFLNKNWVFCKNSADVRMGFAPLAWYFERIIGNETICGFSEEWPLSLLVKAPAESKTYRYTPKDSFFLFFKGEPYLLVVVQSDRNEDGRYKMLLQAACATRLRNELHRDEHVSLIITAMYITTEGQMERYFLFPSDSDVGHVNYTKDVFYLKQPEDLFTALFEMYNLASVIQSETKPLKDVKLQILALEEHILKNFRETFTLKEMQTDVYNARHVSEVFTQAGYTLESASNSDGWTPLNELSPAMRFGKHSSGTSVIVKHLRSRCDELSILQHLNSIKSSENHTIPLLKSFSLDVGTFIVVPEYNPLELGLRFGDLGGKTVNLSNQLIEGVAFIHRNGVAHLDIKPRNILVRSQDDRLYIIDFDISVRVDGPNHFTDIWCGTVGWMAPEIGGPNRLYSPIRADLWSCGRVIRYLIGYNSSKEAEELKALSRRLLDPNPLMRPLLHLPASGVHRPPKRKANALENP